MGIRETLNQKPGITTAATLVIIGVTLCIIIYQSWESSDPTPPASRGWFTIDDGKNWFADEIDKVSADYGGKPVYRVTVFTCDGGATTFAGYLMRSPANGEGMEVKPPLSGDGAWMKQNDPRAQALLQPVCKETNLPAIRVEP